MKRNLADAFDIDCGGLGEKNSLVEMLTRTSRMFESVDRISRPLGAVSAALAQAELVHKHGGYQLTDLIQNNQLLESMRRHQALFEGSKHIADLSDAHKRLFDAGALSRVNFDSALVKSLALPREYGAAARLHELITHKCGAERSAIWGPQLAAMIAPASTLLGTGLFDRATGVLTAIESGGASLAWLHACDVDQPVLAAAALMEGRAEPANRNIQIRCAVDCSICGDAMLADVENVDWQSDEEVVIDLSVFPLCSACTRRADGRQDYWLEHFPGTIKPRFELIAGGGEGNREPSGILRAVRDDEEPRI